MSFNAIPENKILAKIFEYMHRLILPSLYADAISTKILLI